MKRSTRYRIVRLHGMGIRHKLSLFIGFFLFLTVVNGLGAMLQSNIVVHDYRSITNSNDLVTKVLVSSASNATLSSAAQSYAQTGNVAFKSSYADTPKRLNDVIEANEAGDSSQRAIIKQLVVAGNHLEGVEQTAIKEVDDGQRASATALLQGKAYQTWLTYYSSVLSQFRVQESASAADLRQRIDATWDRMARLYWVGVITTALLCGVMSLVVARSIVRPIVYLERAARALSRGNLQTRVEVTSHDEIGRLGVAFNKMAVALDEESNRSSERLAKITKDLGED